jgi:hypothetical protein
MKNTDTEIPVSKKVGTHHYLGQHKNDLMGRHKPKVGLETS